MSTHHVNIGNTPHIASEVMLHGSVTSTTDWEDVTCETCLMMKPHSMTIHVQGCPAFAVENLDCDCPSIPVAGW